MAGHVFARVICGICGRACIPLADFDAPTCFRCENDVDAILTRAGLTHQVVAQVLPPTRLPVPKRPRKSFYGPAAQPVLDELLAELFPYRVRGRSMSAKTIPGVRQ